MRTSDDFSDLAAHYTAVAEDSGMDEKIREAARLFSMAEGLLNKEEDHQESLRCAADARKLFLEASDWDGVVDSRRLMAHACRVQAHWMMFSPNNGGIAPEAEPPCLAQADAELTEEIKDADVGGRTQGVLLLSRAEVRVDRFGKDNIKDGIGDAQDAHKIFKDLGYIKLEGGALLLLAKAHAKLGKSGEAMRLAQEALFLFRQEGEKKLVAKALHTIAAMRLAGDLTRAAFDLSASDAKQALAIYQDQGIQKLEAFELFSLAKWYLKRNKLQDALPMARQARNIFKEIGYGKGWQAHALQMEVEVLIVMEQFQTARKTAMDGVQEFRAAGDKRCTVLALEAFIIAEFHFNTNTERNLNLSKKADMQEALDAAREGVGLGKELADRKWEANMHHNIAQIQLWNKELPKAQKALKTALKLFRTIGDFDSEATVLQTLTDIYVQKKDLRQGVLFATEVRRLYQELGFRDDEAKALRRLAKVIAMTGNFQKALDAAMEAQALCEADGDAKGEGDAWQQVAEVRQGNGQQEEALAALKKMRTRYMQAGDKTAQAQGMCFYAQVCRENKMWNDAVRMAKDAVSCARAAEDLRAEGEMLIVLAQAQCGSWMKLAPPAGSDAEKASEEKALEAANHAWEIATTIGESGDILLQGLTLMVKADAYLLGKRLQEAIETAEEAAALLRSAEERSFEGHALLLCAEAHFALDAGVGALALQLAEQALEAFRAAADKDGEARAQETIDHFRKALLAKEGVKATGAGLDPRLADVVATGISLAVPQKQGLNMADVQKMVMTSAIETSGAEELDQDTPLMDAGLDSLGAVTFRTELSAKSGLTLSATLVFDYPSAREVAQHMVEVSQE